MADRRERGASLSTTLLAAMRGWQAELWTSMPGIIREFNPGKRTCSVQVSLLMQERTPRGEILPAEIPLLVDCPVVFPSGGGYCLTFPLSDGDECLVVFSSRCIDAWWQSGGVQPQAEFRMHDLSDGFVIPGPVSQPRRPSQGVAQDGVELRSNDGSSSVKISDSGEVTVKSATRIVLDAPSVIVAGKELVGHRHTNGNNGGPTGPQI